jgi:hypothetical protein
LLRGLGDRGLADRDVRELYRLVDWFLELPKELDGPLRSELYQYELEKKMPYITSFERLAREEGKREGLLESLAISLEARFGEMGTAFAQELQAVSDIDTLRKIQRNIVVASNSIDDLRALLNQN